MPLDKSQFSKSDLMQCAISAFDNYFGNNINVVEQSFSESQGGYFVLRYMYIPLKYQICFEHERLLFSIRLTKEDESFTSLNEICGGHVNNSLNKENIIESIKLLSDFVTTQEIKFYKIKKNKRVEIREQ